MTIVACAFKAVSGSGTSASNAATADSSATTGSTGYLLHVLFGRLVLSAVGADVAVGGASARQPGRPDGDAAVDAVDRLGKWLSVFRDRPLAGGRSRADRPGPGDQSAAAAVAAGTTWPPWNLSDRLPAGGLLAVTILAHGAVMTSLGLGLATWVRTTGQGDRHQRDRVRPRSPSPGRCVGLDELPSRPPGPDSVRWDLLSPISTVAADRGVTSCGPVYHYRMPIGNIAVCDVAVLLAAIILLVANIRTFDRHLGRMPEGRDPPRSRRSWRIGPRHAAAARGMPESRPNGAGRAALLRPDPRLTLPRCPPATSCTGRRSAAGRWAARARAT